MFLVFACTTAGACLATFLALSEVTDADHRMRPYIVKPKPKGSGGGDPLLALFSWLKASAQAGVDAASAWWRQRTGAAGSGRSSSAAGRDLIPRGARGHDEVCAAQTCPALTAWGRLHLCSADCDALTFLFTFRWIPRSTMEGMRGMCGSPFCRRRAGQMTRRHVGGDDRHRHGREGAGAPVRGGSGGAHAVAAAHTPSNRIDTRRSTH